MGEKEDLMALAFMVGGEINNIKQTAGDRSRFVSESLPNPRDFVLNVANQDITNAINASKAQDAAIRRQLTKDEPQPVKAQPQTQSISNSNNDVLLQQILGELKTLNDLAKKIAIRAGIQ